MPAETVNVRYIVDDMEAAVAWYTTHLGFTFSLRGVGFFASISASRTRQDDCGLKALIRSRVLGRRERALSFRSLSLCLRFTALLCSSSRLVDARASFRSRCILSTWQASAVHHEGSWWPCWGAWLVTHSSAGRVAASPLGAPGKGYPPLCDAPGNYVRGS